MRKNQTSLSAMGIAIMRAVESEKPEAEWRGPGMNGYMVARERYIDDVLAGFVNQGLHQVVILGAGYDSSSCFVVQPLDMPRFASYTQ